ncbi:MAG: peptide chain release factor N(5)-glutamine methyltransferase [Verrucomicrobia bacterium]|nr:peptide chain release factor N(5)-glutamine methyltransferase [Verrucomicrobiota bacterium]
MTTLEVLNAAASYLDKQGVESPRLNAEHLLAHVLGRKKRIELYLEFERPLGEAERAPLRELVKRRGEGVPLQHLLGTVEFHGREFLCDARALVPRPETEQLVELAAKMLQAPSRIVDVGTGSGVIALTMAFLFPEAGVAGGDVSGDALALAAANREGLGLAERVELLESDLLAAFAGPFDAVLANLPYIPTGEVAGLSREVRCDPLSALDGGADGLALVRRLVAEAGGKMSPGGLLALEIGIGQAAAVAEVLSSNNWRDIAVERDYQGAERFVFARHG